MLELSNPVKTERQSASDVARLLESEQTRSLSSWQRHQRPQGFSVKNLMRGLQNRFSHTGDLDEQIQSLVEQQVQQRTRELFRQANYDALTHLPNRAYFHNTLEKLVINAQNESAEFSLLFLDLDGFKLVNDQCGHQIGDELLRNVGARLISAVREGDIVSRLGGDEFVILLADVEDRELVESICQRVIDEVSRPYLLSGKDVEVSTSIGVARYPGDGVTSAELIENADKALYDSKHSGRKTFCFYSDLGSVPAKNSRVLELEQAVSDNQIELLFEPQIDLHGNKVVGASVTAYWRNAELDNPRLNCWINELEQSNAHYGLGLWLLDSGLFYLQQWSKGRDSLMVSVPVVKALWKENDLLELMNQRLEKFNLSPAQIQLEFSALELNSDQQLIKVLMQLSHAGFQITLTDIASSPIDIALLAQLNVQELKLDVAHAQSKWLSALVMMAKSLDICVIANGLEDAQQLHMVKQAGCAMGQGEYWGKPVNSQAFAEMIA